MDNGAATPGPFAVAGCRCWPGRRRACCRNQFHSRAVAEGSMLRRSFQGSRRSLGGLESAGSWSAIRASSWLNRTPPPTPRGGGPPLPPPSGLRALAFAGAANLIEGRGLQLQRAAPPDSNLLCLAGQICRHPPDSPESPSSAWQWHRTCPATGPSRSLASRSRRGPQAARSPPAALASPAQLGQGSGLPGGAD